MCVCVCVCPIMKHTHTKPTVSPPWCSPDCLGEGWRSEVARRRPAMSVERAEQLRPTDLKTSVHQMVNSSYIFLFVYVQVIYQYSIQY